MSVPSRTAEQVRVVMLAQGYEESTKPEDFDSDSPSVVDRQFFFSDMELGEPIDVSGEIHATWLMAIHVGFMPKKRGDADMGRWEALDAAQALHVAFQQDSTIITDAFHTDSATIEFNDLIGCWELDMRIRWMTSEVV